MSKERQVFCLRLRCRRARGLDHDSFAVLRFDVISSVGAKYVCGIAGGQKSSFCQSWIRLVFMELN